MVFICSENRKQYGFGHRSRALALIDYLNLLGIDYQYLITDLEWREEMEKLNKSITYFNHSSGDQHEAKAILDLIQEKNKFLVYLTFTLTRD